MSVTVRAIPTSAGSRHIDNRNVCRCATEIRGRGSATISELAELTGLSRPTVAAALAYLVENGIVSEAEGEQQRGRPARQYRFRKEAGTFVGVDAGAHTIRAVVADLAGVVLSSADVSSDGLPGHQRLDAVYDVVRSVLGDAGRSERSVSAIGVGVSGLVGKDGVLVLSTRYPDWQGVDIARKMASEFGCAVEVDNDINFASLAEARIGAARLFSDMLYVSLGHQVSIGLVLGGRIRRGSHNAAGEVSRKTFGVPLDTKGDIVWRSGTSAADVFVAAQAGDHDAELELTRFIEGIAQGISVLSLALDPDAIVFGGGMTRAGMALVQPLADAIRAQIDIPAVPTILASELGTQSIAYGALVRAAEIGTYAMLGEWADPPRIRVPVGFA